MQVATQLKQDSEFVRAVSSYVDSLSDADDSADVEDPVGFERTSNSRLEIQAEGQQVVVRGKGWVIGNAVPPGIVELAYEIKQEDKDDECSCLGVSLVPDPPLSAEYRSSGTPFITLRCFSGEIYKEGQVVHVSDQFKAHPGDTVHVLIDSDAGTINFQVNEVAPVTVVSDLQGKTVYPVGFFYLGDAQASERWPIIELSVTISRVGKALASATAVDAPLAFTLLGDQHSLLSQDGGSASPPMLQQEGSLIRRLPSLSRGGRSTSYAYAVGPGETAGVHTYRFKAITGLPTCCGLVSGDVLEPSPARLTRGPPESLRCALAVAAWASGRVCAGVQPQGLQALALETDATRASSEVLTLRLKLVAGSEGRLELFRGTKLVYELSHVLRYLPAGTPVHPFVAMLAGGDSVTVDHQLIVRKELQGLDRKKWATRILETVLLIDRLHRESSLEPPRLLSLPGLLSYLQESGPAYRLADLLAELRHRLPACTTDPSDAADVASALVTAARKHPGDADLRRQVASILALPAFEPHAALLVEAGITPVLLQTLEAEGGDLALCHDVLKLLGWLLEVLPPAFRSYVRSLGVWPVVAQHWEKGDRAGYLKVARLVLEGGPGVASESLAELVEAKQLQSVARLLASAYGQGGPAEDEAALLLTLHRLLTGSGGPDGEAGPLASLQRVAAQRVCLAFPYFYSPDTISELETALPPVASPALLDPNYRRKMAELLEMWRGHVSREGVASRSWLDAAFWALKDGDVALLKSLLLVPHFHAMVAERPAFTPGARGPWQAVLGPVGALPATLLRANDELVRMGYGSAETRALLVWQAREFRKAKKEMDSRRPSEQPTGGAAGGGKRRLFKYPRLDGSLGLFAVDARATAPFGFQHDDLVYAAAAPQWGYGRVIGVEGRRLWLHFQADGGATTSASGDWDLADLHLVRSCKDPGTGISEVFRLPLDRGTRVVRGPDVSDEDHTRRQGAAPLYPSTP